MNAVDSTLANFRLEVCLAEVVTEKSVNPVAMNLFLRYSGVVFLTGGCLGQEVAYFCLNSNVLFLIMWANQIFYQNYPILNKKFITLLQMHIKSCSQSLSQSQQQNFSQSQKIQLTLKTQNITMSQTQAVNSTGSNFYASQGRSLGSDFIYDETYKSYKMKQKFEKDPKYSYFNAVMQMKHKLSAKEQLYKSVFEVGEGEEQQPGSKEQDARRTFYSKANQSIFDPDTQIVKVEKLKRNSFRIVKQQPNSDPLSIMKKHQSLNQVPHPSQTTQSFHRSGHRSNMSLYQKHNTTHISFQMTTKARNNKSYVQLQVTNPMTPMNQTFYQPSNPKPRLDEIMQEYRKMNRHSHYHKSRKSTLPKEFIERLCQTNKMFYLKDGLSAGNKKRMSMY